MLKMQKDWRNQFFINNQTQTKLFGNVRYKILSRFVIMCWYIHRNKYYNNSYFSKAWMLFEYILNFPTSKHHFSIIWCLQIIVIFDSDVLRSLCGCTLSCCGEMHLLPRWIPPITHRPEAKWTSSMIKRIKLSTQQLFSKCHIMDVILVLKEGGGTCLSGRK